MILDKKQIQVIFFFYSSSKWVRKQQRQLAPWMHLAQELLTNTQCSGGSRSFPKDMRTLKMKIIVAGHRKWTITKWEQSSKKVDPLTTTWEVAEELNIEHSMVISHLKQTGKVKSSVSGCLVSWLKIKEIIIFEVSSSLILHNNNKPFLHQIVICNEKWFYTTTGNDQLSS